MRTFLTALLAALLLAAPLAAAAQTPSYADGGDGPDGGDAQIRGRILSFDGGYNLQVRDDRGYVDNIVLHQGTIINPTGLTLAPGMVVSVLGANGGSYFDANEIDTPYTYYSGVPYYGGHPWSYYGTGISLGFFFGNAGWWHGPGYGPYRAYGYGGYGGYGGPRYGSYGGARVYNNVHVNTIYRGGSGYVSHGGYSGGYQGGGGYHGGSYPAGGNGGYHGGGSYHGAAGSGGYHGSGGGGYHGGGGGGGNHGGGGHH